MKGIYENINYEIIFFLAGSVTYTSGLTKTTNGKKREETFASWKKIFYSHLEQTIQASSCLTGTGEGHFCRNKADYSMTKKSKLPKPFLPICSQSSVQHQCFLGELVKTPSLLRTFSPLNFVNFFIINHNVICSIYCKSSPFKLPPLECLSLGHWNPHPPFPHVLWPK